MSGAAYCQLSLGCVYKISTRGVRSERQQLVGCKGSSSDEPSADLEADSSSASQGQRRESETEVRESEGEHMKIHNCTAR